MYKKLDVDFFLLTKKQLEYARSLRNKNKRYFFSNTTITPQQQLSWFKKLKKEKLDFYIIYVNGQMAGTFSIEEDKPYNFLNHIILDNKWRGKGVLNILLQKIKKIYKTNRFELYVRIDNIRALKAYEKIGFKVFAYGMRT